MNDKIHDCDAKSSVSLIKNDNFWPCAAVFFQLITEACSKYKFIYICTILSLLVQDYLRLILRKSSTCKQPFHNISLF